MVSNDGKHIQFLLRVSLSNLQVVEGRLLPKLRGQIFALASVLPRFAYEAEAWPRSQPKYCRERTAT